ncbi:ABC transporter permease [Nocardioides aquiterrae]|uniref:ABC3 transporter permease C-terminal domain-containing protein n=1 Tax=Nocardioides aquiterrae TaxID=203799 RepID=A0ABP4F1I6_9ACTN
MTWRWLAGLARKRPVRLLATAAGVAIAVSLLAALGGFVVGSEQTMTDRVAAGVAVDWQVAVAPRHDPAQVVDALRADPRTTAAVRVGFADAPGLHARSGGTVQDTGAARVLGLPPTYRATFPQAVRVLVGNTDGPVVAQQTAANLHVTPGDTITIRRAGRPPYQVRITGVVELPQADSLFQRIGAPPQSQPVAPPDNVVLLPTARFDAVYAGTPVSTQIHVARDHAALPHSPDAAFTEETGAANNLEVRTSGAAVVGNNLGAALDAAREDAGYARILFLFLAVPGAVLAAGLTGAVAQAGAERRRNEQALLRARGAAPGRLVRLALLEAGLVGLVGVLVGLAVAWVTGATPVLSWDVAAATVGVGVAALVVAAPAVRDVRALAADQAARSRSRSRPAWMRYGLDLLLIAAGLVIVRVSGQNKYTLVLAPEGVPTVSVSYWAFLGPTLAWAGAGLLCWRVADGILTRGRRLVTAAARPSLGALAPTGASMLRRRRRVIARSTVLLALAIAYACSTATFNSTYRQQAEVDAQLTNGADVTVTEPVGADVPPSYADRLGQVAGVRSVEPMLHRFAYVGNDLQDLYGIDPTGITRATHLQDSYFQQATATQALAGLQARPDGILVSAETVNDFQLSPGDLVRLRIQDARTHRYVTVPFHYVGIVNEFPTAPKDSFIVANADYVAARTHSDAVGTFLIDTGGRDITGVADRVSAVVGTDGSVGTLLQARGLVGSSLTSVDLSRLTRLELAFALLLAMAAGGLVLGLGLAERQRGIALITSLGASVRQTRRLAATEPVYVLVVGTVIGLAAGWALASLTVTVLTGVFDPPPTSLAVPWTYLAVVVVGAAASVLAGTVLVTRRARARARDLLRGT